jgi:hypothetical protein
MFMLCGTSDSVRQPSPRGYGCAFLCSIVGSCYSRFCCAWFRFTTGLRHCLPPVFVNHTRARCRCQASSLATRLPRATLVRQTFCVVRIVVLVVHPPRHPPSAREIRRDLCRGRHNFCGTPLPLHGGGGEYHFCFPCPPFLRNVR